MCVSQFFSLPPLPHHYEESYTVEEAVVNLDVAADTVRLVIEGTNNLTTLLAQHLNGATCVGYNVSIQYTINISKDDPITGTTPPVAIGNVTFIKFGAG